MKKIVFYFWHQFKQFLLNPFWLNWAVVALILLAFGLNGFLWYEWWKKYQELIGAMPIGYSSAVLILNIFLGNLSYRKETLVSFILLGTGLFVQVIYIIFIKFFALSQTF